MKSHGQRGDPSLPSGPPPIAQDDSNLDLSIARVVSSLRFSARAVKWLRMTLNTRGRLDTMFRTSIAFALLVVAFPVVADEARGKAIHDATVLVDEGKVDQAIAALKKLVAEDPADTTAAYELGLAYAAKGDNANCRATLDPIADAKGPNQVKAVGMLGNGLDQLGETDKAIAVYRHGLELAPDDSGLLFNLAITLIQHDKADEGRELLKHDIEKSTEHASAH